MQFVLLLVAIVAGLRFGLQHWGHTVGAIGLAIVDIWILYRAAVASAVVPGISTRHAGCCAASCCLDNDGCI